MKFHASLVFECMRKVYYQIKFPELTYFPQELRERGLRAEIIAKEGLEALMDLKLRRGRKTKIRFQDFSIVCLPDYVDLRKRLVVEVKSVRSPRELEKGWVGQLNLYMLALSYRNGLLVQVDSSGILNVSELSFDESLVGEAIAYFESLNDCIKNERLPDKDKTACNRFCSFLEMCSSVD